MGWNRSLLTLHRFAPFVYDAWKNPETLAIVSQIAGVDLVLGINFEIAHINLSMNTKQQRIEELDVIRDGKVEDAEEGISGCPREDNKPIVDWHTEKLHFERAMAES